VAVVAGENTGGSGSGDNIFFLGNTEETSIQQAKHKRTKDEQCA